MNNHPKMLVREDIKAIAAIIQRDIIPLGCSSVRPFEVGDGYRTNFGMFRISVAKFPFSEHYAMRVWDNDLDVLVAETDGFTNWSELAGLYTTMSLRRLPRELHPAAFEGCVKKLEETIRNEKSFGSDA